MSTDIIMHLKQSCKVVVNLHSSHKQKIEKGKTSCGGTHVACPPETTFQKLIYCSWIQIKRGKAGTHQIPRNGCLGIGEAVGLGGVGAKGTE